MTVYYEDLVPGMSASMTKVLGEHEVALFGEACGDMNPVHFDEAAARKTIFRGRVVHGMLTASLLSAILGTKLPGAGGIALSLSTTFKGPVRLGQEVTGTVVVREVQEKRKVIFDAFCTVEGKVVLEAVAEVLAPSKPRSLTK